ncbi:MAG TPA: NADH-quinone oxidoreductase subunit C [Candidatus Goldiibacteriota bacterium]|nr:NADH-quinone oxidoreductase subunit C [Candidatus Goldiibacteriota bacterium]
MTTQELLEKIKGKIQITESKEDLGVLNISVNKSVLKNSIISLKDDFGFDHMNFMTAIDLPADSCIEAVYRLYSNTTKDSIVIKVKLDRKEPKTDSVAGIFRTADWHERETAEMFGIEFTGHPDPRRFLLTEDIVNPLRKDFTHPDFNPMPKV